MARRPSPKRSALQALKQKLFRGSTELLLTRLVAETTLSPAQVERIQKLLDVQPKRKKKK